MGDLVVGKVNLAINGKDRDPRQGLIEAASDLVDKVRKAQESAHSDAVKTFDNMVKKGVDPDKAAELATTVESKRLDQLDKVVGAQVSRIASAGDTGPPLLTDDLRK